MKLDAKNVLAPAAILFAICVVVAAALAGTNILTKDRIAQQAALKAGESRALVLPGAEAFEEAPDGSHYIGKDGSGTSVGYVFETEGKGYGGTVKVMTGISTEGEITGVVVLSHSETPGLGANAEKETFRDQYKQPVPADGISVVKFQVPKEGEIQAMTGATITSTAVTNAVNSAIEMYTDAYASEGGN